MQRITITIDDDLLEAVDDFMKRRGYSSRSEVMRDLVRERLVSERIQDPEAHCIGVLSYVFEHEVRELSRRLTNAYHHRHDLSVATTHIHLNHDSCLEVSVLRGAPADVQSFADTVSSQRGVHHAHLHVIPAHITTEEHRHGDGHVAHEHVEI